MTEYRYELRLAQSDQVLRGLSVTDLLGLLEAGVALASDAVRRQGSDDPWQPLQQWAGARPRPAVLHRRRASVPSPRPRQRPSSPNAAGDAIELELTPMIDVVFQLLIFFMLTGYFATAPRADLPTARAGEGTTVEDKLVIDLLPDDTAEQTKIWIEDAEQPARWEELDELISKHLAGRSEVLIRADRRVRVGAVRRVLQAATKAGATATVVGVRGKRP